MTSQHNLEKLQRRYDLDWLRVLVILFVFFYNVGLIFIADAFVFDNDRTSTVLGQVLGLSSFLRMPVLFFIAGVGTWFVFRRRSGSAYLRERGKRLGIPLIVVMLTLLPLQHYYVSNFHSERHQSLLSAWSEYLRAAIPGIHEHWSHLWFIGYLFIFSVVATPLFLYLRANQGEAIKERLVQRINGPIGLMAPALPLMIIQWALYWKYPTAWAIVDDWARVLGFFTLFVYGYVLSGSDHFWNVVDRYKGTMLVIGIVCLTFTVGFRLALGSPGDTLWSPTYTVVTTLLALNGWIWLVTILGYARQFLSFENGLLCYARDASYPVYLLHHPIIIAVGFYVLPMQMDPVAKFVVISSASLVITLVAYEFVVRRWQVVRVGFGMKPNAAGGITTIVLGWLRQQMGALAHSLRAWKQT